MLGLHFDQSLNRVTGAVVRINQGVMRRAHQHQVFILVYIRVVCVIPRAADAPGTNMRLFTDNGYAKSSRAASFRVNKERLKATRECALIACTRP
jgi:hypothetical protein